MAEFQFRARSPRGRIVRGTMKAGDLAEARGELSGAGYSEIRLAPVQAVPRGLLPRLSRPPLREISLCTHQLAVMLDSGIDLSRALEALVRQPAHPALEAALREVHADVVTGSSLSRALGRHGELFGMVYVGLVRAGEASGTLPAVLHHLGRLLERERILRARVQSALTYPAIVALVSLAVGWLIVHHILPTFLNQLLAGVGDLPLATRLLLGATELLSNPYLLGLAVTLAGLGGVLLVQYFQTPRGRYQLQSLLLQAPLVGGVERRVLLSRFSRTLGTLLDSGVPTLHALELTGSALAHYRLSEALERVQSDLRAGESLAGSLRSLELFPPLVWHLVQAGEESGKVAELLQKAADFYDQELEGILETATAVLEPLLVGILGAFVGFVLIALFTPIYQLIATL